MVALQVKREWIWDNLSQFAQETDDIGRDNLDHICELYDLKKEELTEEMIMELYDYTDCDTEVIRAVIDKYWKGTYFVEYVDDKNCGIIRAVEFEQ